MMGPQKKATEKLFYYNISIEKRIPKDHILRRVAEVVDFGFVRQKVESYYGYNGHESEDPIVVLKLMFLLFFENVKSERELLRTLPMRLDWLWFLGLDLDSEVPHHSVLSKARKRWGATVFEQLFVQVVGSCVEAGLVEGRKIHMDGSLVDADASQKSVICGAEELIAALKRSYGVQERKLEAVDEEEAGEEYQKKNRQLVSRTDPDAAETVVADSQYGTNENFAWCGNRGVEAHMGDVLAKRSSPVFGADQFEWDEEKDCYWCPAGQELRRAKVKKPGKRKRWVYRASTQTCRSCEFRSQCTRNQQGGRKLYRYVQQEAMDRARAQSYSRQAYRDRRRRKYLMEGSFADAANNHHFKRSRWRRLDRQQMQDYLIAACQNVRTMLRWAPQEMAGVAATSFSYSLALFLRFWSRLGGIFLLYSGCFLSNHHELELRSANTGGAI